MTNPIEQLFVERFGEDESILQISLKLGLSYSSIYAGYIYGSNMRLGKRFKRALKDHLRMTDQEIVMLAEDYARWRMDHITGR